MLRFFLSTVYRRFRRHRESFIGLQ
jgi:hypothetical protein